METLRTKLEALKELYKLEQAKVARMSEKEELAEGKATLLGVWCAFHVTVGIAYLVVGALHYDKCVYSNASLFLIVGGSLMVIGFFWFFLSLMCPPGGKASGAICAIFCLSCFLVAIWGSVGVFGAYSDVELKDDTLETFCPPQAFYFAFVSLVFVWVFIPVLFGCVCSWACYKINQHENRGTTLS